MMDTTLPLLIFASVQLDMVTETLWFSLVAIFLTHRSIKQQFIGMMHWIERICGGLMIALGLKLALSKIN